MHRTFDWEAVERSSDFRALVSSRRKFIVRAGSSMMGLALLYVVIAGVAPDVLAVEIIGSITLGYIAGCGLLVATWIVCQAYVRRSDREWEPLAMQIVADAEASSGEAERSGRFARADEPASSPREGVQ